ncbi:MAG: thioredoxin domain-containing protein [Acidimicrobiales bacterium]
MERVVLAAAAVAVAAVVAYVVQRRRPAPPTQSAWTVPAQLDRDDFDSPAAPWLVAVFTSATCDSCQVALDKARVLASGDVVVQDVEATARKDLHDRYHIDAVPTIVIADQDGVVRKSFVGPPTATDLWAAVAGAREPGGGAPACDH